MIKCSQDILNEYDLEFFEDIKQAVGVDSQVEVFLKYKDFLFMLEPHGEEINVCSKGELLGRYKNFDDMAKNFMLDGKPFIERVSEIEYN